MNTPPLLSLLAFQKATRASYRTVRKCLSLPDSHPNALRSYFDGHRVWILASEVERWTRPRVGNPTFIKRG